MPDFLDAECVISSLFEQKILTPKNWYLPKATEIYDVIFEMADSPRIAGFAVYIRDGRHCIGTTALFNQSKRFVFPIERIIEKCQAA